MIQLKQILCIHLPHWPMTRRYRRRRGAPDFILIVETIGQRRQVVDASAAAIRRGVRCGMSLAEARMLSPSVVCVEHDAAGDRRRLEILGRWMTRFTPVVSIGWSEESGKAPSDAPALLFLDVSGCQRFFGGIQSIIAQVAGALAHFRIPASVAVAPTPGAAWAFASTSSPKDVGLMIEADQLTSALASLPLEALRLKADAIAALQHLGLRTIGQVLDLPREQLPARFGTELLTRIDQITGALPEPLVGLDYQVPIAAGIEFESPVDALESIWLIMERLLDEVLVDLVSQGRGARRMELFLKPERTSASLPVTKAISLSRPSRDRATLLDLLHRATEQLNCDGGFLRFNLNILLHERVTDEQVLFFDDEAYTGQLELDRLFERLSVRLGEEVIVRPELVESYVPERAWRAEAGSGYRAPKMAPAVAIASRKLSIVPSMAPAIAVTRPLYLLPKPAEIFVICEPSDERTGRPRQFTWREKIYRLTHATGPERIAGEWWRRHRHTRDYYDVEEETGLRFWIFRVLYEFGGAMASTRWFVHGRFE